MPCTLSCGVPHARCDGADAFVAGALYERAIGYTHKAEKIHVLKDGTVVRVPYIQHYPPDIPALNFFLANRQRDLWRHDPVAGDPNINFSLEQLVLDSMKLREADEAKAKVIEHEPTEPEKTKGSAKSIESWSNINYVRSTLEPYPSLNPSKPVAKRHIPSGAACPPAGRHRQFARAIESVNLEPEPALGGAGLEEAATSLGCNSVRASHARARARAEDDETAGPPPVAQQLEQLRRQHGVAALAALALLDPQRHALGGPAGRASL